MIQKARREKLYRVSGAAKMHSGYPDRQSTGHARAEKVSPVRIDGRTVLPEGERSRFILGFDR